MNKPIDQGKDNRNECNNDDNCLDSCLAMGYDEYKELKRRYAQAVEANRDLFIIFGKEMLTVYAKYVLEYIENRTHWHVK